MRDARPRAAHLRARAVGRGAQRGANRRRDRHGRAPRGRSSGRSSRSMASTSSSGCSRRRGSATCWTRSAGTASCAARVAELVEALRSNEAALRELVVDPAELERRLELARHAVDEIEAAAPRDGEVDELQGPTGSRRQRPAHRRLARQRRTTTWPATAAARTTGWRARRVPRPSWPGSIRRPQASPSVWPGSRPRSTTSALELRRRQEGISEAAGDSQAIEERLSASVWADAQVRRDRGRGHRARRGGARGGRSGCATRTPNARAGEAEAELGWARPRAPPPPSSARRAARPPRSLGGAGDRAAGRARLPIGRLRRQHRRRAARRVRGRRGHVPARAEPGRAAAAAGAHRVRRGDVARRAGAQDRARPGGRDADADLRRGRCRHRRPIGRSRRASCCGASAATTR